jgi:hypothetical protein
MGLDKPEFLISLVLQNFSEQRYVVVLLEVGLDAINDGRDPLNNQTFESVSLVQVGVHKLLHSFSGQLALHSLLVVLQFLRINIVDHILQLL